MSSLDVIYEFLDKDGFNYLEYNTDIFLETIWKWPGEWFEPDILDRCYTILWCARAAGRKIEGESDNDILYKVLDGIDYALRYKSYLCEEDNSKFYGKVHILEDEVLWAKEKGKPLFCWWNKDDDKLREWQLEELPGICKEVEQILN